MTEDEAKTKWCPFVRTKTMAFSQGELPGVAGVNRDFDGVPVDRLHTCLGSACMAWREIHDVATETTRSAQRPEGDGWLPGPGYDDWTRQRADFVGGYCGLAGRPE